MAERVGLKPFIWGKQRWSLITYDRTVSTYLHLTPQNNTAFVSFFLVIPHVNTRGPPAKFMPPFFGPPPSTERNGALISPEIPHRELFTSRQRVHTVFFSVHNISTAINRQRIRPTNPQTQRPRTSDGSPFRGGTPRLQLASARSWRLNESIRQKGCERLHFQINSVFVY